MWVGGQRHGPIALPPGKGPSRHCTGGWVGPGSIWTGAENLAATGYRTPDHPARKEPLYGLAHEVLTVMSIQITVLCDVTPCTRSLVRGLFTR
jgi:hypothetical protein